jgi:murein DD-endopeptidase MepM/ murein hydrolase activator NlpD
MSTKKIGFRVKSVYRMRKPKMLALAKQKLSFIVASMSLFAFVMGNMVGQHGWYAFWKTVLGAEDDSMIAFVGTVPPIAKIPDYQVWATYGGSKELHTYSQIPQDVLRDLPAYSVADITGPEPTLAKQAYSTMWAGGYNTTQGSHAGVDIDAPRGTPVVSIANGVVEKVSMQKNGFGHHILIRHPNVPDGSSTTTLYSTYAHLDAVLVSEGMVVHKGQTIGTVGNTGLVFGKTGYHLYFQINTADAPFHPYWPFTSGEIASAGMSFVQAVDSTQFQDRLFRYTLNPMSFVQKYATYTPTSVIAQANRSVQVSRVPVAAVSNAERLRLFAAERAKERRAKIGVTVVAMSSSSSRMIDLSPVVSLSAFHTISHIISFEKCHFYIVGTTKNACRYNF